MSLSHQMILREGRSPAPSNNRALRTMQMQTNKVKRMLPSVSYVIALWRTGVWSRFRVGCEIMTHTRLAGGGGVLLICDRPSRAGCVSWLCARLPAARVHSHCLSVTVTVRRDSFQLIMYCRLWYRLRVRRQPARAVWQCGRGVFKRGTFIHRV